MAFAWAFRVCLLLMGAAVLSIMLIREGPVGVLARAKPPETATEP